MGTTEQKRTEVINEISLWLQTPNAKRFYHDKPIEQITQILAQPKLPKSLLVDLKLINTWYGHHFVYETLTGAANKSTQSDFASMAFYTAVIASLFAQGYPGNPPKLQFTDMTYWLALCLHARWHVQASQLIQAIDGELDTKFLHGGENFNKVAWFIIQVTNNGFDVPIDYSRYKYPRDMGVYHAALEAWDTTDTKAMDNLVSHLCDYHLSQANFAEEKFYEFSFVDQYVFVYEVHAWLSMREKRGLLNPSTFSHPVMRLPINLPQKAKLPFKKFDFAEQVVSRLKEEFPFAR